MTQTQYGNPMIYVTENGVSEKMHCTDLCDNWRMKYLKDYVNEMLKGERVLAARVTWLGGGGPDDDVSLL